MRRNKKNNKLFKLKASDNTGFFYFPVLKLTVYEMTFFQDAVIEKSDANTA